MFDEKLKKSLTDLIDETIAEIEDLKKSNPLSAAEIKLEGPGEGIDGKPCNGELDAKKADDEDDDEDEKEEKDADVKVEVEKGVLDEAEKSGVEKGVNEVADPNAGKHQPVAKADEYVKKGVNGEADSNAGEHKSVEKSAEEDEDLKKSDDDESKDKKEELTKSEDRDEEMKKSLESMENLMKSYVDEKITPLEEKMNSILTAVKELSDMPVERAGVPANATPLQKSIEVEPLSKSAVIDKLLELKKSNSSSVPTEDVTRAELGGPADLETLINKYDLRD